MINSAFKAKALININGVYKEVDIELTKNEWDLLNKSQKIRYSLGVSSKRNPVDATLEEYSQT